MLTIFRWLRRLLGEVSELDARTTLAERSRRFVR
jgi:hypothetical protein